MDTSTSKRPCCSSPEATNPLSALPNHQIHTNMDALLQSFIALSDIPTPSLNLSLDRIISVTDSDYDQNDLIERALRLGSVLLEAGKRSARQRASMLNAVVWPLPADLTVKVFSMIGTQGVCYAAATCSFFRRCALDPSCYADIDLTTAAPKVNNVVVSTMIQRAGKMLQSLKLGIIPGPTAPFGSSQPLGYSTRNFTHYASGYSWNEKRPRQGNESSSLTRACLNSLTGEGCAPGFLLRRLHLHNIERMDHAALFVALSSCPSLLDLEIVGLHVELRQTLESVSKHCHLIERLFFESSKTGRDDSLKLPTCSDLVNNCSNLTSLALRGFKLYDYNARLLVKGFRNLKSVDFSTSYSITGAFLKNLGCSLGGNQLEVLILQDCMHIKEVEMSSFLSAVLAGDFKLLKHLDISNREGLASEEDWYHRCYSTSFIPFEQLLQQRPELRLLAEFPQEESFVDAERMLLSDVNSDFSMESQLSSHTSDGSPSMNTSASTCNSDPSSGNDDSLDTRLILYEESSDDVKLFYL